jgi:hypothetical protein
VIATVGRMDQLHDKDRVETLIRSLSRFSEKALLILSGKSDVTANSLTIGPTLIFQKLWKESGIQDSIKHVVADRKFEFDVERAIFMTVLHRLVASGSDRHCDRWRRDYLLPGTENIDLHHLYRAMAFLGEPLADSLQENDPGIRRNKDRIEEMMFQHNKDLFQIKIRIEKSDKSLLQAMTKFSTQVHIAPMVHQILSGQICLWLLT